MELDKSVIGLAGEVFFFNVEQSRIRQFAEALGDHNPLYADEKYASETIYKGIIAPPTFPVVIGSGSEGSFPIKLDEKRMLHGEQEFIYYRPIRPGDRLFCQMKIRDLYEREGKNGKMQCLIVDTEVKDEESKMVVISRLNIIYRSLPAEEGVS
ncbi:MaoC family dehydratase N-terminal domain-containing protein [Pseudobacillus badius]|uniref:MaoC family dehydratase N-terminal domain-containing protein n=1 Tax=Bacillus badius TaxID=1455 RepID=UPI001CC10334|nr:MaoC family dehydratase N-terminal domain-containing protein [Bacillus badius]MED0665906.1 MaoC family dehydratase N-terminal domain-containing protein [Bacillus badius]UAT32093.1 MaoC family dehydratase N-terminal domain-containing protein [Bacillus badius]GLY11177.1 UPF0336 protein [Bacillus badius]